eukprot:Hpha_TRINITY_DN16476_c2_g1::TRINITY_DN16476_c2_g1_i2::g.160528::m.160528
MLSIQRLNVTLSVSLVLITGGIIGWLSVSAGIQATDRTKATLQRGLFATSKMCRLGFEQLNSTAVDGLDQCLSSARQNAEFLTQLVMSQALSNIAGSINSFFDIAQYSTELTHSAFLGMSTAQWGNPLLWHERINPDVRSLYYQGYLRGITLLSVFYDGPPVDGVEPDQSLSLGISAAVDPTPEYSAHSVVSPIRFYCDGRSEAECSAANCVWCSNGIHGYCGNPMRKINGEIQPCRVSAGFSPPPGYTANKWYQTGLPYAMGIADERGEVYFGSCGVDDPECGCAALRDYRLKRGNDLLHTGIGRYKRADGTYPKPGEVPKSELLEAGACELPESLAGLTINGVVRESAKFGYGVVHWANPYGVAPSPLLTLQCFTTSLIGDHRITVYAGVNLQKVSELMNNNSGLPEESRMYLVQTNAWKEVGLCQDDFHGVLARIRMDCKALSSLLATLMPGKEVCEIDLHSLSPRIARLNFVREHCPSMCGVCQGSKYPFSEYEGYLLGSSHGLAFRYLDTSDFINVSGRPDQAAIKATESTDPVVSAHAKMVMTNLSGFQGLEKDSQWSDQEGRLWWVKRETIVFGRLRATQLRLTLVLLVLRNTAMQLIDEATEHTRSVISERNAAATSWFAEKERETAEQIQHDDKETEEARSRGLIVMSVVAAVSVIILQSVSVVFVRLIIRPLLVLESEMADVALMRLDFVDRRRELSRLAEVAAMQVSFFKMVSQLSMYKSFMPHSVLCEVSADDHDRDASVSPPASPRSVNHNDPDMISSLECSPNAHMRTSESKVMKTVPRHARVSLVAANMLGYLTRSAGAHELDGETNEDWIAADVEQWCASVLGVKGIVDLMSGDRRYASFNARQHCSDHASAAVEVLSLREDRVWSGCVVTGQVVCGDFGSFSVLRFMVLGGVASSLHPFERIAARWCIKGLADVAAYSSSCYQWQGTLLAALFVPKRGSAPLRVFSMTTRRPQGQEEEWMYALQRMEASPCEGPNAQREAQIKECLREGVPEGDVAAEESAREDTVVWRVTEVGLSDYQHLRGLS